MATPDQGRFAPGTHIVVWRRIVPGLGYHHHGIFISDDRVIQFGGGIRDKPRATVSPVTLEEFERGQSARAVQHGGRTWWGVPRFPVVAPEVAVRRAERLVAMKPRGIYNLFGANCEQVANFCSTDSYESYQVRGFFALRWLASWPLLLYAAARARDDRLPSPVTRFLLYGWMTTGMLSNFLYYRRGERFMREVGRPIIEWERQTGGDT